MLLNFVGLQMLFLHSIFLILWLPILSRERKSGLFCQVPETLVSEFLRE